ncbi:cysteine desulfurase [Anoxybacillus pushchinoensis]|uniref:Cysteine desulfurase n=1 Tax=Anoxybacillus pushchinoensis TaxID=150248 RepID=A0A1I0U0M8_9BACL|nr:cysteine desulfurase family protein [Anoxybacillus pushchinoensis]SFA57669.1 cysteine desulfurase [Anoxybacillus pushchinoensis]
MMYLDNSATTKPFQEVLQSFLKVASDHFGNPSSLHGLGMQAERLLTQAREQVARLLGVKPTEIIFTSGGTEGNNLAIKGVAWQHQKRGRHIITTAIEHPSVTEACKQLEQLGFQVTYVPVDERGIVSPLHIEQALRDDTILVSVMHVNNEVGSIQPIEEIGMLLKKYPKVLFHVDGVQGAAKVPLHLKQANVDLYTASAHKFHGLKGAGILYVREGVRLSPLLSGGAQEMQLRSGTENVAAIVAMAKALRLSIETYSEASAQLEQMKRAIIEHLQTIEGIVVHTPVDHSAPHIIHFSLEGIKSEAFVHELEKHHIYVSTTSACSSRKKAPSKTLLAMGVEQARAERSIRISLSYEQRMEHVPIMIEAMKRAYERLKIVARGTK